MRIQHLNRVIGVVARHPAKLVSRLGDDADAAIALRNLRIGIEQRFLQLPERSCAGNVREIRSGKTAAAADRMASRAVRLTKEQRAASLYITGSGAVEGHRGQV